MNLSYKISLCIKGAVKWLFFEENYKSLGKLKASNNIEENINFIYIEGKISYFNTT